MRVSFFIFLLIIVTCSSWHAKEFENSEKWSTLEECRRPCSDDEPPRHCYYHFTIEYYVTMGSACTLCRQSDTNQLLNVPLCQCVEADGVERTILSVNRLLPGPSIQVCQHDMLIIDVENKAEGLEVILHWHGLFQKGYQYYDGVPMVTQCPILSGNTFRFQFAAANAGTFFYHSHILTHRMDGQYGSLVIRQTPSTDPNWSQYDEDLPNHVILVSDWLHTLSTELYPGHYTKPGQTPDNLLINGRGRWMASSWNYTDTQLATFYVKPGKRYRFRFINAFSTVCPSIFTIENHNISVIAQDAESVHPDLVTSLHSSSGERVDFVLTANQNPGSYWIQLRGLRECSEKKIHQLAILSYLRVSEVPKSPAPTYKKHLPKGRVHNPPDGKCDKKRSKAICVNQFNTTKAVDERLTKGEPDQRIILPFSIHFFEDNYKKLYVPNTYKKFFQTANQAVSASMIDNIIYTPSKMPLISQNPGPNDTCSRNHNIANCATPCYCTHVIDSKKDSVVEVILYDELPAKVLTHPFHLHGYAFTVLKIGPYQPSRNISRHDIDLIIKDHQEKLKSTGYNHQSPKKDTILVPSGGYVIFRFIADNPGWWLFHCHFAWHSSTGMQMVIHVGEQKDLPPIPPNFPKCGSWKPPPQPLVSSLGTT